MPIGTKKRGKNNGMGDYTPSDKEQEAYVWGIRNGLRIAPRACNNGNSNSQWKVEIYLNNRWNSSDVTFGPVEVWEQIYKYYIYYYDKRKL